MTSITFPTFASTPFFYDRSADRGSYSGASEDHLEGESWRGAGKGSGSSGVGVHSSPRVSYYFPKGVGEYHFGERHPMKPHRLTLTNHLVIGYELHKKMDMYQPRGATKEELEAFHDEDYVDFLSRVTPNNVREFTDVLSRFNVGDDCPIFGDMFEYCRQYAGASLMAGRKIVEGTTDIAINWTGGLHHAKKSEASGFCYVNDIVLAILELLRVHARVLYIDIDIHHGDGVQEAFYNSNRVLTVSFHKYSADFFPGTGHIDEVGHSLGKYFSLNVPLQDGIDNESYVALFKSIMEPTIATFQPSSIVLQCGADSLGCDRLGCFNLSISAHGECVRFIKAFGLPLVVLGGGGYTIKNVSRCWTYETAVLLDMHQDLPNSLPHTAYDDFFAPDWKLHPDLVAGRMRIENMNTKQGLEKIRIGILERLRYMHGAPSVGMVEIPPSLAPWLEEEEKEAEELEDKSGGANTRRDEHRASNNWYDGELGDGDDLAFANAARSSGTGQASSIVLGFYGGQREKRASAITASAALMTSGNSGHGGSDKSINASVSTPRPRARTAASGSGRSTGGIAGNAAGGGGGSTARRRKPAASTSATGTTSYSTNATPTTTSSSRSIPFAVTSAVTLPRIIDMTSLPALPLSVAPTPVPSSSSMTIDAVLLPPLPVAPLPTLPPEEAAATLMALVPEVKEESIEASAFESAPAGVEGKVINASSIPQEEGIPVVVDDTVTSIDIMEGVDAVVADEVMNEA